jgi:hypothetical protein
MSARWQHFQGYDAAQIANRYDEVVRRLGDA